MGDPKYSAAPALVVLLAVAACQAADRHPEPAGDSIGPVTFTCDDGSTIEATFDNAPDPATVLLVRGDQTFTLPQAMSGSWRALPRRRHRVLEQGQRCDGRLAGTEARVQYG
jgi:Membrane-bound lysozyme-inhibitor of c-type lysozyme